MYIYVHSGRIGFPGFPDNHKFIPQKIQKFQEHHVKTVINRIF